MVFWLEAPKRISNGYKSLFIDTHHPLSEKERLILEGLRSSDYSTVPRAIRLVVKKLVELTLYSNYIIAVSQEEMIKRVIVGEDISLESKVLNSITKSEYVQRISVMAERDKYHLALSETLLNERG